MTATTTNTARAEFLEDVLLIAIGGGINYWATVVNTGENTYRVDDQERGGRYTLGLVEVRRGINRIKNNADLLPKAVGKQIVAASYANDAGDIDAGLADIVVQVGLFNERIYG